MTEASKSSMEQTIYEHIKQAILKRQLAPGTQLLEHVVSERFRASRTPIRAALRKLALEGLVDLIPNRGAFVIQPTEEEVREAYELRSKLELMGLEMAAARLTEEDYERMAKACREELEALERGDVAAALAANKAFHSLLARKSGNRFLASMTEHLLDKTNIYLILYDLFYDAPYRAGIDPIPQGAQQHKAILEALRSGRASEASELLRAHIDLAIGDLKTARPGYLSLEDLWKA